MKNKNHNKNYDNMETFNDIMSRNDRKNYQKLLKEEQQNNENKQDIKEEIKHVENKQPKAIDKEIIHECKTKKSIGLIIFSIISLILSLGYLGFNLIFAKDEINNTFLIVNASILALFALFLTLTMIISKLKVKNILGIFTSIIFSGFIIFNFLVAKDIINLPTQALLENFTGKSITEALKWAKENNIDVKQIYEYSDNILEYNIITQSVSPNTLLKKVDEITFTVSYGPNYDKIVSIPNMVGWEIDSAIKTINENFLNNVNIEYEINDEVKKDIIINQSTSGQIRRNDELTLTVSLGREDELEPVEMINLQDKSLFEATLWLKRHGIKYEIEYVFSDKVKKDFVVGQKTEVGEMVDPKEDTVTLVISKGKKIIVPDLTKMTVDEVTTWIMENNLKVSFESKYDSSIEAGKIIEADYSENDEVEAGTIITVTISKGPLKMPKFNNVTEFRNWANSNSIEYREEYEFNDEINNGDIIKTIPEADTVINYSDTIIIKISYGKPVTIPNFIGKSRGEIENTCYNIGLNCTFYYNGYSNTPYDIAQNQNKVEGAQVVSGTYVSIGLSSGPKPAENNQPNNDKPQENPPTNQCTSTEQHRLKIEKDWIMGGSAQATINTLTQKLKEKYPNVKFDFGKDSCNLPAGYISEKSPITNNSTIKDCQDKAYTIIVCE